MIRRLEATVLAAFVAVAVACAFVSGMTSPLPGRADPKPALAVTGIERDQGNGWFLLDTGFGYEGLPILYRVDRGVLYVFTPYP
jgi:hypothetical protein